MAKYYVNIMKREKEVVEKQSDFVVETSLDKVEEILIDLFNLLY